MESPACYPEFSTPLELIGFIARLRQFSGGKPIGFKLCIGRKSEFLGIIKAMLETGVYPDFITVDGSEGGSGAAPVEFSNRLGMPCLEATYFVHQMLRGVGIRQYIRIIAAGKTATGYELLEKIATGADSVNAASSMMLALGCIQAKICNTNKCATGIATTDPARAVDLQDKSMRVYNFHRTTMKAFLEFCGAMGYSTPDQLQASAIHCRTENGVRNYDQILTPLDEDQLPGESIPDAYISDWHAASAKTF